MRKLFIIALSIFFIGSISASEKIVWDFSSGMQGWHDLGEGRDVVATWENGSLKMDYFDGSPDHNNDTEQLWFAGVQVEHSFLAEDYPFLEIYYTPVNWPTEDPVKILLQFQKPDGSLSYAYVDMDPKKSFLSVDIAANDPSWGQPYSGTMTTVYIELPHNGSSHSNPAKAWFESETLINKVVLTDTPTTATQVAKWSFDKDFNESIAGLGVQPVGSPVVSAPEAKFGEGGLSLDGTSYLQMEANEVFSSPNASFLFWVKTKKQVAGKTERIISSGDGTGFDLGIQDGNLCFYNGTWTTVLPGWSDNEWKRIAVIAEGKDISIYVNGEKKSTFNYENQNRSGQFFIGGNKDGGITGSIDEFAIFNYALTEQELIRDYETLPDTEVRWSFDEDFADNSNEFTALAVGSPVIDKADYKEGTGSLKTSVGNYLKIARNPVISSGQITFSLWVKTPDAEQTQNPSYLFTYESGLFGLAIKDGALCYQNSSEQAWTVLSPKWENNIWKKVTLVVNGGKVLCYINGQRRNTVEVQKGDDRNGELYIGKDLTASIDELSIYNYALSEKDITGDDFVAPNILEAWTFQKDLEGWYVIEDGNKRDVELSWDNGAMLLTYVDNAKDQGPQLWFPNVEVKTKFDAGLYQYCDIHYEAKNWPVSSPVKALMEFTKSDNKIAYAFFDLDPNQNFVRVNIPASDPTWGAKYDGEINLIRLEIPHNSSANPAEPWFGASTRITEIRFNDGGKEVDEIWNEVLGNSNMEKDGIDRFNSPQFQYYSIGLGGTNLRVDPWGFAYDRAPNTNQNSYNHKPSFGYEYWWDNEGHRMNPFIIRGGYNVDEGRYGIKFRSGTITAFNQKLDITTGVVITTLGLKVGDTEFTSVRETFVTPEGVLVVRVKDQGAPSPVNLFVDVNEKVEFFGTYYDGEEEPFVKDEDNTVKFGEPDVNGAYLTAKRTGTSHSSVAVAVDATSDVTITNDCEMFSQAAADGTITFYISPKSSYCPATGETPWTFAGDAAVRAKTKGYDALKNETAEWWNSYYNVSKVSVPDKTISKLYAQSLFYHGIYFGNSSIPPGCFGTDSYGFFGGVCPEYDLAFSSFAMAYTGHINETKNIADWVYSVLPKCKEQAKNGVKHHDVFRKYDEGAIYTTIMGYDGTITIQGEPQEGSNLLQNYPGINAARMALNYLDYSDDQSFKDAAYDVLKSTTYIALKDLADNGKDGFKDGKIPNCMQEGAVLMGFDQCVKRGIAEPEWIDKYSGKIEYPAGTLNGKPVLSAGCGYNPAIGEGGNTWTYPLWWATVVDKEDPMAVNYVENCHETFESYCFNNGWNGVANAKVFKGNNALMWLRNFERPDVLLDETSFSENASSAGINYTPEIGAHGVYICNLTQMLIDPDRENSVDIFPAVPDEWEYKTIGFDNLMAIGALSFSAKRDLYGLSVSIENKATTERTRKIRIKAPRILKVHAISDVDFKLEDGFIIFDAVLNAGETKEYTFEFYTTEWVDFVETVEVEQAEFKIFPNPNVSRILNVTNSECVDILEMYSLQGQIVKRFEGKTSTYNISDCAPGHYIVSILSEGKRHSQHLIVK